jgi:uncharacterized protein YbaR (Trm112 family)/ubiquinone/menaquinone biosynthesis C-methylase UbiE
MFEKNLSNCLGILVCPETKMKLTLHTLGEAEAKMQCRLAPLRGTSFFEVTSQVLVREDLKAAYPVVDGIPILLIPEILGNKNDQWEINMHDPKYSEAYEEMDFYNRFSIKEAEQINESDAYSIVEKIYKAKKTEIASFPSPKEVWIDAIYDCAAQWDAYNHIAPIKGKRILQVGGKGIHAVKFLIGGAEEAWVISPMLGEAYFTMALAKAFNVADRIHFAVSIAEELPFQSDLFDAAYSGGCLHHFVTKLALPEIARVLIKGGRFSAADPWRAPLHAIGTRIFGKRETAVHCHPLTKERIKPLCNEFEVSQIIQHGTITRYLMLALSKFGLNSSVSLVWQINKIDDAICSCIPGMRAMGSSVVCLGAK